MTTFQNSTNAGGGVAITVAQTAHGFSVGNWLYYTGTAYALAEANADSTSEVIGVVSAVIDANDFVLTIVGYVAGLSGLTAGNTYFLSDVTGGAMTSTVTTTTTSINKPVFIASSTTAGYVLQSRGFIVGGTNGAASTTLMKAASNTTSYTTPGYQAYHPGSSKAGVTITPGGTTTTFTYNVSSVTRTAAGDYTVNFTTSFVNTTDMRVYASCISASTALDMTVESVAVGSVRVQFRNLTGTLTDPSGAIMVDVFGSFN